MSLARRVVTPLLYVSLLAIVSPFTPPQPAQAQAPVKKRVNSDADPIDLIRAFLHMAPRADDECGDEDGGVEVATE